MIKKTPQVDLEELLGEAHGPEADPTAPLPPKAYYDFFKTSGAGSAVFTDGPTMTRQEFAEDCDINVLMKRFENRDIGSIMRASAEPVYADFASMPSDLMGAMEALSEAENAFMTLPATVRREFDNDPVQFVEFATQPDNLPKLREWGLAPPLPQQSPASLPAGGTPPHTPLLDNSVRSDTTLKDKGKTDEKA